MKLSRRTRRRVLTGGGIVIAGGAAWWQFGRATVSRTNEVSMTVNQFQPRNIRVEPGTEVTWKNLDNHAHTVVSASDNWDVDELISGASGGQAPEFSYTFENAGVYDVYCKIHGQSDLSGMSMKIGVGRDIGSPLGGWL